MPTSATSPRESSGGRGERPPRPPTTKAAALRRVAELALLEAWESPRLRRPLRRPPFGRPPLPHGAVPRSLDEIDCTWLSDALGREVPGARVLAVRTAAESSGTTTRCRLELDYNEAGRRARLPEAIFVKCSLSLPQRVMLGLGGLSHGEANFYQEVRPLVEGIEAPRGLYAAVDQRSWRSVVITEDVQSTRGAEFWRPGWALERREVEDLLGGLAVLHATFWESPRLERWHWLRSTAEQIDLIDSLISLANRLPAGERRARAVIPVSLQGRSQEIFHGLRRSMHAAARPPGTYLHGDLHVANTYRTAAGTAAGAPARMGIADWQVGLRGSWAFDFTYLLVTALEPEARRAWQRGLLAHYLTALHRQGGPRIAFEPAWLEYRRSTFYPYFAWVYTLGRSRLQPRFQSDAVTLTLIRRITAAMEDLESLAAIDG